MGKIVKFCSECEEGFAEKFGFCPNCGSSLEAFEMNPLQKTTAPAESNRSEFMQPDKPAYVSSTDSFGNPRIVEEPEFSGHDEFADDEIFELTDEKEQPKETVISEPSRKSNVVVPAAATAATTTAYSTNGNSTNGNSANGYSVNGNSTNGNTVNGNAARQDYRQFTNADAVNGKGNVRDGFNVTVIEEKNVGQRNLLLFGSAILMLTLLMGGFIYSLFAKTLDLAAIGDENYIDAISDPTPVEIEEPEKPKAADKESGGGGGGGREEQTETSKGRLADQSREEPIIRPDVNIYRRENPELKQPPATTVGDKKFEKTDEPYGNPNSTSPFGSNGRGRGGGQGEGEGTGQGNGRGTGAGNGNGSGFGNGNGDGNGNGNGSGNTTNDRDRVAEPPKPPAPSGPSKDLQITFKPKPKYTDEARQNNITGNVRVRVTFLPSGQIGSVSPVSNLGYGLTEQALAAAKAIKFEPKLENGRPVAVTRVVVFSFTIY